MPRRPGPLARSSAMSAGQPALAPRPTADRQARQDRAALTYLAEPADPALGALLTVCEPAEVLAAIKADSLPQAWLQSEDSPARRRALEAALGRWRLRLPWLPDDAGLADAHRDGIRLVCPADPEWPA